MGSSQYVGTLTVWCLWSSALLRRFSQATRRGIWLEPSGHIGCYVNSPRSIRLVAIIMGKLTDKYGARIIIAIGALIGGLSYWLMSDVSSIWKLYLYFGIGIGVCIGSSYTPINATVSKWFVEKRAFAIGITLIGISVGSILLPPLITYIITTHDWHDAYIMMSIIVCITAVPIVTLLGRKPQQPAEAADDKPIRTR